VGELLGDVFAFFLDFLDPGCDQRRVDAGFDSRAVPG
jgi:hypothetical protein